MLRYKSYLKLFICLVIIFVIFVWLRHIENRLVFYPLRRIEAVPSQIGFSFEDVYFKTSDGIQLNGWFVPCAQAQYTILLCHGNAGNISHRLEKIKFFNNLGCNILVFDYRGYGRSKGKPTEKGFYRDVQAAYEYLLSKNLKAEDIIGYGESVGGAVVIDLAYKNNLRAIITEGTLSSVKDVAKNNFLYLPSWLLSVNFNSLGKINKIIVPKLMIHSVDDEVVPYGLGIKLYENAQNPKEFLEIRGGHNSGFFGSEELLKEKIGDFLRRL